ncbi:MAG: hypothetical protein ABEJ87_04930 [Candidatus Nanohalobium sp.]
MRLKGQSAIEYMSTYGWMLVVVAIAAGVFYNSYLPHNQCREQMSSPMTNQLKIADMAADTNGDLALLVRNMGAHKATVQRITLTSGSNTTSLDTNVSISPVDEDAFRLNGTAKASSCQEVDVKIEFNSTELGIVSDTGTIRGKFKVE